MAEDRSRSYRREGIKAALLSLCRGSCYWPDCGVPVVRFEGTIPVSNLDIAHIRAAKPGGARYDESMTDEEIDDFSNLILLCRTHHQIVDKLRKDDYSVETLLQWKSEREASGQAALEGLREVTEDRLQEMIAEALTSRDERIEDALNRFQQLDSEAAGLLRDLLDEVAELRQLGSILDLDAVSLLNRAADNLHVDIDTAGLLNDAANKLHIDGEMASLLNQAADKLATLDQDKINRLAGAAYMLTNTLTPGMIEQLHIAARELRDSRGPM